MKIKLYKIMILSGMIMIFVSGILGIKNIKEDQMAGESAKEVIEEMEQIAVQEYIISEDNVDPDMPMKEKTIHDNTYIGILQIPSLNLSLPIINEWSYDNLKKAPCLYKGSIYEEQMIICGHNYNSHFGRLKNLTLGEQISFQDFEKKDHMYTVVEVEILNPDAIEQMEGSEADLTLFTCTLGGQTRYTVRCKKI